MSLTELNKKRLNLIKNLSLNGKWMDKKIENVGLTDEAVNQIKLEFLKNLPDNMSMGMKAKINKLLNSEDL